MKYVVILKGHNILNRFIFNIIRIIVWNLCCDRNCTIYLCSYFLEIINLSFYVFSIYFVLVFFKSYKEIDFNVHTKLIFHFIKIVDRFLTAEGWKVALKLLSSSLLSARHKNDKHIVMQHNCKQFIYLMTFVFLFFVASLFFVTFGFIAQLRFNYTTTIYIYFAFV